MIVKINHYCKLTLLSVFTLFSNHITKANDISDEELQLNKNIIEHKNVLQIGLYNRLLASLGKKLHHHDYVMGKLLLCHKCEDNYSSSVDTMSQIFFKSFGINLDYTYFVNNLVGFSGKVLLLKNRGYYYEYSHDPKKKGGSQQLIPYEFHVLPGIKLNVLKDGLNFLDKKQEGIRVMLGFHFGSVFQKINIPKTKDIAIDLQKFIEPNLINWAILLDTNITFTNDLSTSFGFLFVWGQLCKWKNNELSDDDIVKISKKAKNINIKSRKETESMNNELHNINEHSYDFRIQSFITINYDLTHCF